MPGIHLRSQCTVGLGATLCALCHYKEPKKERGKLAEDSEHNTVAERSSSFLDRVQMYAKPMPQPLLHGGWQTPATVMKTLAPDLHDLEPTLARYGYNVKVLAELLNIHHAEVRTFLHGQLPPGRTEELHHQLLALGLPLTASLSPARPATWPQDDIAALSMFVLTESEQSRMFSSCSQIMQARPQIIQAGWWLHSHIIQVTTGDCSQADALTFSIRYNYWSQRRHRAQTTAGRAGQLARRQHGLCPGCHQALDNGEELHVHHVRPKHHGGTEDLANLQLVHQNCHHQIHSISAPLGVRRLLEPCTR
jgi:hypothetical protein